MDTKSLKNTDIKSTNFPTYGQLYYPEKKVIFLLQSALPKHTQATWYLWSFKLTTMAWLEHWKRTSSLITWQNQPIPTSASSQSSSKISVKEAGGGGDSPTKLTEWEETTNFEAVKQMSSWLSRPEKLRILPTFCQQTGPSK